LLIQEYGITPSILRHDNYYDNAIAKNFFHISKSECINLQKIESFAIAKHSIDGAIHFYTFERIQFKSKPMPFKLRRSA